MKTPAHQQAVDRTLDHLEQEPAHVRQVTRLALQLFDGLVSLHGLGPAERDLLESAALLHDIGWSVSGSGHHKHSERLILENLGNPYTPAECRMIAAVARYHRKSPPKSKHALYGSFSPREREVCRRLAALLRIADGLDRSHRSAVYRIVCTISETQLVLRLATVGPVSVELSVLPEKTRLFEDVYGRRVEVLVEPASLFDSVGGPAPV